MYAYARFGIWPRLVLSIVGFAAVWWSCEDKRMAGSAEDIAIILNYDINQPHARAKKHVKFAAGVSFFLLQHWCAFGMHDSPGQGMGPPWLLLIVTSVRLSPAWNHNPGQAVWPPWCSEPA